MEISKLTATANPSAFGMPACGHGRSAIGTVKTAGTAVSTFVARNRRAVVTGDMGLAVPAYSQGTTAWSPPTS